MKLSSISEVRRLSEKLEETKKQKAKWESLKDAMLVPRPPDTTQRSVPSWGMPESIQVSKSLAIDILDAQIKELQGQLVQLGVEID